MVKWVLLAVFVFSTSNLLAQVRESWRPIYDRDGRLTRMIFYSNGIAITDSTHYYQYYTDNILKGKIQGEIQQNQGCTNGLIYLYNYNGNLTNYSIKSEGNVVFSVDCDESENCTSTWVDRFETNSGYWVSDSLSLRNGLLQLHNSESMQRAIYYPAVPIDIHNNFTCSVRIPIEGNSAKQGLLLGWKDDQNYFLIEISYGEYYTVLSYDDGAFTQISNGRQKIEKTTNDFNEISVTINEKNLIFKLNGNIEMVLPLPNFNGDHIGLVTRSRGTAKFGGVFFQYPLQKTDPFYSNKWIGKGTGFFVSKDGKIITTTDVIMDTKDLRVKASINGKNVILPVSIYQIEEEHNLAILKVDMEGFSPFEDLPFGYLNHSPASDSKGFAVGFPNAVSGIIMKPSVFEGQVLPVAASYAGSLLLEMSFRYGMIGSPVFDNNANLIGIIDRKGTDINYAEMIDFYENSRLLKLYLGKIEPSLTSPLNDLPHNEKIEKLSECVVIIESSIFSEDSYEDSYQ